MKQEKPQQIRLGKTRLAIWRNQKETNKRSLWFNWKVEKRYQKDGDWETTHTFRDADAPIVILLLVVGTLRMLKQLIAAQNDND